VGAVCALLGADADARLPEPLGYTTTPASHQLSLSSATQSTIKLTLGQVKHEGTTIIAHLHEKTGLINFTADLEYLVDVRVNCRSLHEEMEVTVDLDVKRLRVVVLLPGPPLLLLLGKENTHG
tara:strand:- start:366 stop:734 length:369 start_codon:yes stop_codon:yes gene_type:complete